MMRSSKKRERGDEISIDETRSRLREIADGTFKISRTSKTTGTKTDDLDDDRDDLVEYEDVDVMKKQQKGAAYEDDVPDDDDDEEEEEDNVDELRRGKGRDESDEEVDGESGAANRGRHIRKIRGEDAGPSMEDRKSVV